MVQWLRLSASNASNAGGVGLTPGQGTKIPHAMQCGKKKKKKITFIPYVQRTTTNIYSKFFFYVYILLQNWIHITLYLPFLLTSVVLALSHILFFF